MPDVPTELSELYDLQTVERVIPFQGADHHIYLVGEQHEPPGAPICKRVAENVLDAVEPAGIAIEMPPDSGVPRTSGMGAAREYAHENNIPAYCVDKPRSAMREAADSYMRLSSVANEFSHPIEDDGDLDAQAIRDARNRVANNFSNEAYREMYSRRERHMAKRIQQLYAQLDGPVVWFGGVFHILSISHRLRMTPATDYEHPTSRRLLTETARVA